MQLFYPWYTQGAHQDTHMTTLQTIFLGEVSILGISEQSSIRLVKLKNFYLIPWLPNLDVIKKIIGIEKKEVEKQDECEIEENEREKEKKKN